LCRNFDEAGNLYLSDERVLGSTAFVGSLLKNVGRQEATKARASALDLETVLERVAMDFDVSVSSLSSEGRKRSVSLVRGTLGYLWMRYLGRSGRELAFRLNRSPQSLYQAVARLESRDSETMRKLNAWCRSIVK